MDVATKLGHYALDMKAFKVRLPDLGVFTPEYVINPDELINGKIIGHVVVLPSGPTFLISRITKVHFEDEEFSVIDWPSHVTSEPILHRWDTRIIETNPVPSFFLDFDTVKCTMSFLEL